MRLAAQSTMGYYPTPDLVTEILQARVTYPKDTKFAVLDPCCGQGMALAGLTAGFPAVRYGIEPDRGRFDSAKQRLDYVLHSPIEECRVAYKSFSLLLLNPPYDWEHLDDGNGQKCERKELLFLKRCLPWIAPGGILIYIIPETIWNDSLRRLLAYKFDNIETWRFPEPDYFEFQQIVVIGRRKEKDCQDTLPVIGEIEDFLHTMHAVPESNPDVKLFQTTKVSLEEIERMVPKSPCWTDFLDKARPWTRESERQRRPPLPLHAGHSALLIASGIIDGVVGTSCDSHVVTGKVRRTKDTSFDEEISPETGEKITVRREIGRYDVTIKILNKSGEIRELSS